SWIMISRATSPCHPLPPAHTSMTAQVERVARNGMMATIATSARPEIVACGKMVLSTRDRTGEGEPCASALLSISALTSVVDMQTTLVQHKPTRVDLVHERDVVGGNDDGSPRFVELNEQAQQ